MSPPAIETLLADGGRYNEENLPALEAHVKSQLSDGHYDLDANLAVLKLYLLHPDVSQVDIIEGVLLKSLMAFPATDFSLCMFQVPEKYHQQIKSVVGLAQQLEMAKFKAFWKEAEGVEALAKAKNWQGAVRSFIAGVISVTYRSIKVEQIAELLNIPTKEVDAMIKEKGWTRTKEDKEVVVVNTATFESTKIEEAKPHSSAMSLDQYRTLFMAASSA